MIKIKLHSQDLLAKLLFCLNHWRNWSLSISLWCLKPIPGERISQLILVAHTGVSHPPVADCVWLMLIVAVVVTTVAGSAGPLHWVLAVCQAGIALSTLRPFLSFHNSPARAHATVIIIIAGTRIYREIGMDVFWNQWLVNGIGVLVT